MKNNKSSEDYWRDREDKWLKKCQKQEKDWNAEIDKVYKDMIDEMEEQISVWYQRYADGNSMTYAEAKNYLSRTDIDWYAKKAKEYCRLAQLDRDENSNKRAYIYFSEQANQEMSRYNTTMKINRLEMIKSQMKLRLLNAQTDIEALIEKDLIERAKDEIKRQAGLLGNTVFENYKDAETIAKASFHGARFSTRIWGSHQVKLRKALNKALENSLILGKNVSALLRDFRKITDSGKKQAQRLLATEVCRVQIEAQKRCYVSSGFTQYLFMANSGCCPHCQALDGKHFDVDGMMAGSNAPPMHPNCRCSTAAYTERSDDNSEFNEKDFDEWSETYEKHGLSWDDWKEKQQTIKAEATKKAKKKIKPERPKEQFAPDMFGSEFNTGSEAGNTKRLAKFFNGLNLSKTNPNAIKIYQNIGKLTKRIKNLPFSIGHGKNSALSVGYYYNGGIADVKLSYPKMDKDLGRPYGVTTIHEMGHYVDFLLKNDIENYEEPFMSEKFDKLSRAFETESTKISPKLKKEFEEHKKYRDRIDEQLTKEANEKIKTLNNEYDHGGKMSYKVYQRRFKKIKDDLVSRIDFECRNFNGGGYNTLEDIYDAISGGKYFSNQIVLYGHGSKYYSEQGKKEKETLANFMALTFVRPDLVEELREDKPTLVEALEDLVEEMARRLDEYDGS